MANPVLLVWDLPLGLPLFTVLVALSPIHTRRWTINGTEDQMR